MNHGPLQQARISQGRKELRNTYLANDNGHADYGNLSCLTLRQRTMKLLLSDDAVDQAMVSQTDEIHSTCKTFHQTIILVLHNPSFLKERKHLVSAKIK